MGKGEGAGLKRKGGKGKKGKGTSTREHSPDLNDTIVVKNIKIGLILV